MNGWLKQRKDRTRRDDTWSIILDLGPRRNGKGRRQKWITFHGTKREAQKKLDELKGDAARDEFIEPSRLTVGAWLDSWLEKSVKPRRCGNTYVTYRTAIRNYITPQLGTIRLQQLKPSDIEHYHSLVATTVCKRTKRKISLATRQIHHAILTSALRAAEHDGLVRRNVATLSYRPTVPAAEPPQTSVKAWTAEEACRVLEVARQSDAQTAAFMAVALDSGARKGELRGLRWSDISLESGEMRIERQLLADDELPVFGPTKTRKVRKLDLTTETIGLLREHKRQQAELKMANRNHYSDHGLVFAQSWANSFRKDGRHLGAPFRVSTVHRTVDGLIKQAGVRRITVHGLRHTSATLLLAAGVQPHVVQQRLGHSTISTTLNLYAHVLPSMQQDAASRLALLLYKR